MKCNANCWVFQVLLAGIVVLTLFTRGKGNSSLWTRSQNGTNTVEERVCDSGGNSFFRKAHKSIICGYTKVLIICGYTKVLIICGYTKVLIICGYTKVLIICGYTKVLIICGYTKVLIICGYTKVLIICGFTKVLIICGFTKVLIICGFTKVLIEKKECITSKFHPFYPLQFK